MKSLEEVLSYRHPGVLLRFRRSWAVSEEEAETFFADVLRLLWLFAQDRSAPFAMTAPLGLVDEMWHEFILFTEDYTRFCEHHFGGYVHHRPALPTPPKEDAEDAQAVQRMRDQVTRVYRCLGPAVAVRWYRDFPQRYPATRDLRLAVKA